jgi:hypothetical protein
MSKAKFELGEGVFFHDRFSPLTRPQCFAFRAPSPARGEGEERTIPE